MWAKAPSQKNTGFSVVEIMVAMTIISTSVIAIALTYSNLVGLSVRNTSKVQAAFLLDEGVEAIKTMRGESWSNIASTTPSATYYFAWITNKWKATTTPSLIDGTFLRTFTVSPVYRDGTFNILQDSSGTLDAGTRKVDISVAWLENGATTTRTVSTYIFNLYE